MKRRSSTLLCPAGRDQSSDYERGFVDGYSSGVSAIWRGNDPQHMLRILGKALHAARALVDDNLRFDWRGEEMGSFLRWAKDQTEFSINQMLKGGYAANLQEAVAILDIFRRLGFVEVRHVGKTFMGSRYYIRDPIGGTPWWRRKEPANLAAPPT